MVVSRAEQKSQFLLHCAQESEALIRSFQQSNEALLPSFWLQTTCVAEHTTATMDETMGHLSPTKELISDVIKDCS